MNRMIRSQILAALALGLMAPSAFAITINVQYEDDLDPFFTPVARATLQRAASDVSFAITTSLAPLTQRSFTGVNGSTRASVDWSFSYTSPSTGVVAPEITTFDFAQDEFRVFVGSRGLVGSTLGRGGPGGAGINLSRSGFEAQWDGAVDAMEAASNDQMLRGGPRIGTFNGDFDFGTAPGTYALGYGFSIGSLTFNDLSNWHFDYATLPGSSQSDFYSVAVHEMLHAIGFGTSDAFNDQVSGTDWLGNDVAAVCNCGLNGLHGDQSHVRSGLQGRPLVDGAFDLNTTQEAVMDPTLTTGTRKYLTDLDLAFLRDAGWETVAVPESSIVALLLVAALVAWGTRASRSQRRASSPTDRS